MTLGQIISANDLHDVIKQCQHSLIDEPGNMPIIIYRSTIDDYYLYITIPGWDDVYGWWEGAEVERLKVELSMSNIPVLCDGQTEEELKPWLEIKDNMDMILHT